MRSRPRRSRARLARARRVAALAAACAAASLAAGVAGAAAFPARIDLRAVDGTRVVSQPVIAPGQPDPVFLPFTGDVDGDGLDDVVFGDTVLFGQPEAGAPAAPRDLMVRVGPGDIDLFWAAPAGPGDIVGYRVLVDGEPVAELPSDARDYRLEGVEGDPSRTVSVEALGAAGTMASPATSPRVTERLGDGTDPIAGLRAEVYGPGVVELFWDAEPGRFVLLRDGEPLTAVNGNSYVDRTLEPGRDCRYDAVAPSVPGNLRGVAYSGTAAEIFWDRSRDDGRVVGYEVFRGSEPLGVTDGNSRFDEGLTPGLTCTYQVVAIDDDGNRSELTAVNLVAEPGATGVAPPVGAPGGPDEGAALPAPVRPRIEIYSDTALELFWERPRDPRVTGYRASVDGAAVAETGGTSAFLDTLAAGASARLEIVSLGEGGATSAPVAFAVDLGARTARRTDGGGAGAPATPAGLRGTIYSPTALELFWARVPGATSYEVLSRRPSRRSTARAGSPTGRCRGRGWPTAWWRSTRGVGARRRRRRWSSRRRAAERRARYGQRPSGAASPARTTTHEPLGTLAGW